MSRSQTDIKCFIRSNLLKDNTKILPFFFYSSFSLHFQKKWNVRVEYDRFCFSLDINGFWWLDNGGRLMAGLFLKVIERIGWWWYIAIPRTPPTLSAQWSKNSKIITSALKKKHKNKYSLIFLCGEIFICWYLQTVSI